MAADLYLFKLDGTQYRLHNITRNTTCEEIKNMLINEDDFDINYEHFFLHFGGKKWDQNNETLQEFIVRQEFEHGQRRGREDPRDSEQQPRKTFGRCMKIIDLTEQVAGGYVKKKKSKKRQTKGRKKKRKTKRRKKRSKKKRSGTKRRR